MIEPDADAGTTRVGQDAFNALARWRPDLAALIVASGADPFYDDRRLVAFYLRVAELLEASRCDTPAPPADTPAPDTM
jgi:hypothetical protein